MMVVLVINLYMVRIILSSLGVEDYGIFNVVAGVITLLQSLSITLSASTQRFFSYFLGTNESDKLSEVFSTSIKLYAYFCLIVFFIGETVGLWFINSQLVIPAERMVAANVVYQFSILSFLATMIMATYSSAVISHEDMGLYAIVSLTECFLKLLFAYLIVYQPFDRLCFYASTLTIVTIVSLIIYVIYSRNKYPECRSYVRGNAFTKEMLSFSGWTLFGSLASVCMYQINTILVNIFFGPLVNAARAISMQVNNAINSFASSFLTTVKPPIIKSYAEGNFEQLNVIFSISNKLILYLLGTLSMPLLFEMGNILEWWLNKSDTQTIIFSQLMLIYAVILALNNPISFIIQATGHVKEYNITVEIFTILCMPATYLAFKMGAPAVTTFILMIIAVVCSHVMRLMNLKKYYTAFSFKEYIIGLLLPATIILLLECMLLWFIHNMIDYPLFVKITLMLLSVIVFTFPIIYLWGLNNTEKSIIKKFIRRLK